MLFCCDIKIRRDLRTFSEDFGQEKGFFLGQNSVSYALLQGVYCIYTLYLQICYYAQKLHTCRNNIKYAPDENLYGPFCPRQKAANFCRPAPIAIVIKSIILIMIIGCLTPTTA